MTNQVQPNGRRVFDDIYSFPQDSQDLADDMHARDYFRGGTSAERQSLPTSQHRAGMLWSESDTGLLYRSTGSGWGSIQPRIGMRRAATPGTVSASTYTNLSISTFWVEEFRSGFQSYSDGIVIPAAGVYEISYTISAQANVLAGVTVNKGTGVGVGDLYASATSSTVQGIATATASRKIALNTGDVLRLFGIAQASGGVWRQEPGLSSFQAEYC